MPQKLLERTSAYLPGCRQKLDAEVLAAAAREWTCEIVVLHTAHGQQEDEDMRALTTVYAAARQRS